MCPSIGISVPKLDSGDLSQQKGVVPDRVVQQPLDDIKNEGAAILNGRESHVPTTDVIEGGPGLPPLYNDYQNGFLNTCVVCIVVDVVISSRTKQRGLP